MCILRRVGVCIGDQFLIKIKKPLCSTAVAVVSVAVVDVVVVVIVAVVAVVLVLAVVDVVVVIVACDHFSHYYHYYLQAIASAADHRWTVLANLKGIDCSRKCEWL